MSVIPEIRRPTITPNRSAEIVVTSSLLIAEGTTIYGAGDFIRLYWSSSYGIPEIRIDGTVWAASTRNVSAAFAGFYMDNIIVTGTVVAEARAANSDTGQANAYAISNSAQGRWVTNSGTIYAYTDGGLAHALTHWGPDVRIVNSGLIAARTEATGEIASNQARAVGMSNGGFLHNQAGGRILAEGINAVGVSLGGGAPSDYPDGEPNLINDGTIQAVGLAGTRSVGIGVSHLWIEPMLVRNNGLIEADIAIVTGSSTPADETIHNSSTGIIRGDIVGDVGSETIINEGRIDGNVDLGSGADRFDTTAGIFNGTVALGWGNDTFLGGSSAERVDGGRMDDYLSGGGGNDLLLGGLGNDRLAGGSGNDGLYGDYGDDVFNVQGGDIAFGGHGDDLFQMIDLRFAELDGGEGFDTLALGAIAGTLNLGSILRDSRVTSIEAVDLGSAARGAFAASDLVAALDGLRFTGDQSAQLLLGGSWDDLGPTLIDGQSYNAYRANGFSIFVETGLQVTIAATMPTTTGLSAIAGGAAAPTLASEPGFALANPVWDDAFYSVVEDTVISAAEVWRANASLSALSAFARDANITNYGRIEAASGRAAAVDTLNLFTNHGVITSGSATAEFARAFSGNQQVDLVNTGSILAETSGGPSIAVSLRSRAYNNTPGLINSGTMQAVSASGEAVAVYLIQTGGLASNSGEIIANGGTSAFALHLSEGLAFTNSGMISATAASLSGVDSEVAVYLARNIWRGSFNNSGVISGTTAFFADTTPGYHQGTYNLRNEASGEIRGNILLAAANDTIDNSGTIIGDISLAAGNDTVLNFAVIDGGISMGSGRDTFYNRGGTVSGIIDGGSGADLAHYEGLLTNFAVREVALGQYTVTGAFGTDTLTNFETLRFGGVSVLLDLGTGLTIDVGTADPDSFMVNIRDYDGNDLGGHWSWELIGQADANGDGNMDYIFVNREIGRFAEVGADADGFVRFDNHGMGGDTRVVGIYIDPLVLSGDVEAGSDFDSQRRFQNDLYINNINRVLGADDYDGDGLQEVYFALTDGTAYLHAYMHADGNIRYANYQSQQQVIDFLTANGFDASTWAGWFPSTQEPEAKDAAAATTDAGAADDPLPADRPEAMWDHSSWQSEEWAPRVEAFA